MKKFTVVLAGSGRNEPYRVNREVTMYYSDNHFYLDHEAVINMLTDKDDEFIYTVENQ